MDAVKDLGYTLELSEEFTNPKRGEGQYQVTMKITFDVVDENGVSIRDKALRKSEDLHYSIRRNILCTKLV